MIDLMAGVDISTQGIETVVSLSTPTFIDIRNSSVEYAPNFPNMMYTLWAFICSHRRFPSQTEYTQYFLSVHSSTLSTLNEAAVKARLLRSFPSLIREIHFYALVKESGLFQEVNYSAKLDVEDGTDLSVKCGGYEYGVSCYVQTERSLEYRRRKRSRPRTPKTNSIELPLDLSSGTTVNGWIFYNRNHVHDLLDHIIEYASKNYNQCFLDVMGV
ncbi:hypothetical protein [Paenibacillus sp. URB8-2]|uniref:hypothetical protein n=1 Tax=Paenibacillus sp. URB8-2 TaxID=2741301 RepID=UPI0015BE0BFE|nr:hypothetical protein [Paenibacillus sp. URB8-2]